MITFLTFYGSIPGFVGNDRIAAAYDPGIVPSFIEHSHIQIQDACQVHSTFCGALVRTDCHHVLTVKLKVAVVHNQSLYELIRWTDRLEPT